MKIVTLVENTTSRCDLTAEHGLSLYIETDGHTVLFDMGASGMFGDNAEKMGIGLNRVDFAILSHGHYDHGGGLQRFFKSNDHALVYVNQYAFEPHYNAKEKDIGLDPSLKNNPRILTVAPPVELAPGLTLVTCPLPPADTAGLTVMENGVLQPEDFRHEQYLLIEEAGKRILISGCSHKGILNLMEHFRPDILVGGFHFMKVEDAQALKASAEMLGQYDTRYYTGHCTGEKQYGILKTILLDKLHYLQTGKTVEIL